MALCQWSSSGLSCSRMRLRPRISCHRRPLLQVQASLQLMVKVPMASMGALVATSYRLGPHTAVVSTLAQLMVTAVAIASGACLSAQMDHLLRLKDTSLEEDLVDGVDITGYKIFNEPEVQKALSFARASHAGQMRKTGEPYVTHCIHTAKILAALVPQEGKRAVDTIVAGLLHDVIDDTAIDLNTLRDYFGPDVAKLVSGVSKLSHVNQLLRRHRRTSADTNAMNDVGFTYADVDSLRVMLLGMINDPRVVLIKLADRLHNMRTIYALPQPKAHAVAQETLAVWCSLASRLGVWGVKAELEDLCFAVLQPKTFRKLRAKVAELWRPNKDWRYLRRGKKSNYKGVTDEKELYEEKMNVPEEDDENGDSEEEKEEEDDDEEERVSMKELLESVIPFDVLMDREKRRRMLALCNKPGVDGRKKSKVLQDAELALTALAACEEALEKELLIATSYVPGMEVTLSGRLKNLYSTYCKIKRKGVEVDKVYDARALRVVVGDGGGSLHVQAVEGCYNLLSVIHSLWTPVAGEFDDYIVNPKPSGYQSLHTAVVGPDRAPLEVQIRTQGMHEYAEYGHAAHWLYKEADGSVNTIHSYLALPPINTENENLSYEVTEEEKGLKDTAVTGNSNVLRIPPKLVKSGYPTLKVEGGRLLAAVVLRVENEGRELLVAVSFSMQAREAVAAGRLGNQRGRWETYARLFKRVTDEWWFAPGHGDWSICLEKYTLCQDGIYHKQDQFERSLPAFIQFIELSRQEQKEYWEVMRTVLAGTDVSGSEAYLDSEKALSTLAQDGGSTAARLNNKVRLLRSMLQWEQELRQEVDLDRILNRDNADSLVLVEVVVIRWPDGEIMRMPCGSSAADAARRMGLDGNFLFVNGQVSLPNTILKDGDIIEIRL